MFLHPQVLLNISSHILTSNLHLPQYKVQLGILLGLRSNQRTDVVETLEILYSGQDQILKEDEVRFLRERLELRLRGDQWNLFKNLEVLGWYTTEQIGQKQLQLHSQIASIVNEQEGHSFQYLLTFKQTDSKIYLIDQFQIAEVNFNLEPSNQEMISIDTAIKNTKSPHPTIGDHLDTLNFMDNLLADIQSSLDDERVRQNPILLTKINEMIIQYPHLEQNQTHLQNSQLQLITMIYYSGILKLKADQIQQTI
ncbi:COP9 signalosome complex subunit 6 [Paramecium bursaria]